MILTLIFLGSIGLIVGSYLNVFALRLHTGNSTTGRSGCMSCMQQLTWWELLPVLSFFGLRGRCHACGSAISQQYWIVELSTALLFIWVAAQQFSLFVTIIVLILVSVLVVITIYDIRHTIIPNELLYIAMGVAVIGYAPLILGTSSLYILQTAGKIVFDIIITTAPLALLWGVSRGAWIGFGDVKLAAVFGIVLGAYGGLMSLMIGFVLGAIVGVTLIGISHIKNNIVHKHNARFGRVGMKSELPFAPFLIAGFLLVFLGNVDLIVFFQGLFF